MFKVGSITDQESAPVVVKDPITGKRLATVTLAGPSHPKRKAIEVAKQRRMIAELQRTGKVSVPDPEQQDEDKIDLLVACTLGWDDFTTDNDGVTTILPCNAENARKLYAMDGNGWLVRQLYDALSEQDRFIKSSAATL